ncbi:hypothetical protein BGZ76_008032 [Entomortierella beljakovae]|nr:hypothetical protein BGZ76_008032 [Entomortierella beljakovae]
MECVKNGVATIEKLEADIPDAQFNEIWRELVIVCRGTMAPSLPIPLNEMPLKSQAQDEAFDLVYLHSLKSKVFSRMGYHRVPLETLTELVQILDHSANLYILSTPSVIESTTSFYAPLPSPTPSTTSTLIGNQSKLAESKAPSIIAADESHLDIIQGLGITLHSTTNTMVPVGRERFAFACLESLFDLCSSGQTPSVDTSRTNGTAVASTTVVLNSVETELRNRTAKVTTPVLMQRCQVLLEAYSADQSLLGKCPFPRLRHQEISLVLQRLNDLKLVPGILSSSVSNASEQNDIKQSLLSGPNAHLFYLYEPLTDAMFCHDPEVLSLLKSCLKTAGRSIGLCN